MKTQDSTTTKSALLVVNGDSRHGGEDGVDIARRALEMDGCQVEFARLDSPEMILRTIRRRGRDHDCVIVGGGDGSVSAALPALLSIDRPLGVIPLGTANDFARGLGIPCDPVVAARVVLTGETRAVDVGLANGVPFLNAAGIGLGPAMTREVTSEEKRRWGVLAYLKALLRARPEVDTFGVRIECDGEVRKFSALQVTVANGLYYGGGLAVEATARVDDDTLNVIVVEPASLLPLLRTGFDLRRGEIEESDQLTRLRGRRVRVTTSSTLEVTTDGELTTETPVEFDILSRALRVRVAPEGTDSGGFLATLLSRGNQRSGSGDTFGAT